MRKTILAALAIGLMLGAPAMAQTSAPAPQIWQQTTNSNWLLEAPNDTERFRRLQFILRGTDIPMWEISYRFDMVYEALGLRNYDMATYQWEKIRDSLRGAALKRPNRRPNAEGIFLGGVYEEVAAAFKTKDANKAWEGFDLARGACMSCHEAENLGFMNQSAIFARTEKRPAAR